MSHDVLSDLYNAAGSKSNLVPDPGADGTINLSGKSLAVCEVASGSRYMPKSPPQGTVLFVYAADDSELLDSAGDTVATIDGGRVAACFATSETTWAATILGTQPIMVAPDTEVANALHWGVVPNDSGAGAANKAIIDEMLATTTRRIHFPGVPGSSTTLYYSDGGHTVGTGRMITGDGMDCRLIGTTAITSGTFLTVGTRCTVSDIGIQGTFTTGATGVGFTSAATDINFRNCNIVGWVNNVVFNNAYAITFQGCNILSASNAGFKFTGSGNNSITIRDCEIQSNQTAGVWFNQVCNRVLIDGCTIQGAYDGIIGDANVIFNNVTIRDNYFEIAAGKRPIYWSTGVLMNGYIDGNIFNGTHTDPAIQVTRWDGGRLGSNQHNSTVAYKSVVLDSTVRNVNIEIQGRGQQADYNFGRIHDSGKNFYPAIGKTEAPTIGTWALGQRVVNTGTGTTLGWRCTTAGTLAAAWQAATAYSLGTLVLNDTNKIYVCKTAGTSAGSGGPTGTSTGITDNTVTWDYYGPLAVFTTETGN